MMSAVLVMRNARHRLLIAGLMITLSLFVLMPLQAQDQTNLSVEDAAAVTSVPQERAEMTMVSASERGIDASPLMYGVVIVLAVLLIGAMFYGSYLTRFLSTLVPPETASAIYASGVRFGLELALNTASQTPTPIDDAFFESMARLRGLTVTRRADGTYDVSQALDQTNPRMPV